MNLIKCLIAAALLAGGIASANASDRSLHLLNEGNNDFGPHSVAPGSFLDRIYFDIGSDSSGDFGMGSLSFSLRGIPYLEISGMDMSLFDGNGALLGNGLDFSVGALRSGNYYLQVTGNATGMSGGMYAGSISITSLPVPEPGVGSSLMAGLLMLGFMAMRRRNM